MIDYQRDEQQTIPESLVKIIGLGGAGANMLDRVALDGMEGAELLAINTDIRTLNSSVAAEKVQLGKNLTKGLGCGGDPEMGFQAVCEAEAEIRKSLKDRRIVFICVGLGGGTGSGAISTITRIAREEGAFVVVFATMPFAFEGRRRLEQAKTSLNEIAALSNALVTFENSRMGELVLAKQGIHDAFSAGDRMISDSIRAVIRLVIRPGLINIGLDDLMTALRTTRSRCLFGSGLGSGQNRSQQALKKALSSPLLDRGSLLEDADTVLVHVCGGEDLTLYEVELLMRSLSKHVPSDAQVLFGAAIDPAMKDALSITVISSLPEEKLQASSSEPLENLIEDSSPIVSLGVVDSNPSDDVTPPEVIVETSQTPDEVSENFEDSPIVEKEIVNELLIEDEVKSESSEMLSTEPLEEEVVDAELPTPVSPFSKEETAELSVLPSSPPTKEEPASEEESTESQEQEDEFEEAVISNKQEIPEPTKGPESDSTPEKTALPTQGKKKAADQSELDLKGGARGKFKDQSPSLFDGEDLDIPPYLRKRKKN